MTTAPPRKRRSLAERAIDLAITGGQHQIVIDSAGRTMILPLSADLKQAEDAALDAAILEVTAKGHGVGRS